MMPEQLDIDILPAKSPNFDTYFTCHTKIKSKWVIET